MRLSQQAMAASAVASVFVGAIALARADDTTPQSDHEKQLEKRVEDLERQLTEVNRRLASSGANQAGDELSARVGELEKLTRKDAEGVFPFWKNGFRTESASGKTKFRIGGFIQNDYSLLWSNQDIQQELDARQKAATPTSDPDNQVEGGTQFRRARLMAEGTIYGNVDFKSEFDFAGGAVGFRNVWMAFKGLPIGTLTVGSMKEPFGFEELTPDLFVTFMERSAPSTAFAPAYNTGFQLSDVFCNDSLVWQVGAFREAGGNGDDVANREQGEWNLTGRVAGRPWMNEDKTQYVHLGAAIRSAEPNNDTVGFASKPEMNLAPTIVDTGAIGATKVWMWELESAYVNGPFAATGEFYHADVQREGELDPQFHGWSFEASWFLTGETRGYNAAKATFDRVIPKRNWDDDGGMGAVQLAARYDGLDLSDEHVSGGVQRTLSAGVNWYANPNTKVMLGFVHSHIRDVGNLNGVEMRFQIDF